MSNIECTHCKSSSISVLAWVDETGEVLEVAGDYYLEQEHEPKPLAFCSDCHVYFKPREGYWFSLDLQTKVPYEKYKTKEIS